MKKYILGIGAALLVAGAVAFASTSNTSAKADDCCHPGATCCIKNDSCCKK